MSKAPRSDQARRFWGDDDSATPILHVDMDAFFAAVELRENPSLRGKPVIVGGSNGRGVVCAATYEARSYGVHSAMPVGQALRRCPQAIVLPVRHQLYSQVSKQVMGILGAITPQLEQLSIDEAFLDVSGSRRRLGSPCQIAANLRQQISRQLGVTASVGIGANKLIAKLASAHAKPDGMLLVPASATQEFLDLLPVGAMWGVGDKSERKLHEWGIDSVVDLRRTPRAQLERILGKAAAWHLYNLSRGIDNRPVSPVREEKSISTETTFDTYIHERAQARQVLLDQCHQCAIRLRKHGWQARVVGIKVRDGNFKTLTRSRTLAEPTDTARYLWEQVSELFAALPMPPQGIRLLGVRTESLVRADGAVQLSFDSDERSAKTEKAADAIRERWGAGLIGPAALLGTPKRD